MKLTRIHFYMACCYLMLVAKTAMGDMVLGSQNDYFFKISLGEPHIEKEFIPVKPGDVYSPRQFSKTGKYSFVFQKNDFGGIAAYDVKKHKISVIDSKGFCPVYIPGANSILYFKSIENSDGGHYVGVFLQNFDGANNDSKAVAKLNSASGQHCPMLISENEAIFYEDYDENILLRYSHKDNAIFKYKMTGCRPILSLGNNETFLCLSGDGYAIYKDGRIYEKLDSDVATREKMIPVAYVGEIDSLLISETTFSFWRGEGRNLYIYDLKERKLRKLMERFVLNPGAAIYYSDK